MRDALAFALRSLVRNPVRSGLTVLGLLIGVCAFIAMVSFGEGARRSVVAQFGKLGVNVLSVTPAAVRSGGRPPSPLTPADVEALELERDVIDFVVPVMSVNVDVSHRGREALTRIRATTPRFPDLSGWPFARGGMFDAIDLRDAARVCVLGAAVAEPLFGASDPLDETVLVQGRVPCRVVGVLAQRGRATSGRDLDDIVLMPVTTVFRDLLGGPVEYAWFDVRPRPGVPHDVARATILDVLSHAHGVAPGEDPDFGIRSNDDAIQVAEDVSGILTSLLAGIAAVSLLVGGIGIMNIQLVSVTERTREIGVRAAIGATPSQILLQFLVEALVLALVGTVLGAVLGVGVSIAVANALRWPTSVSAVGVAVAVVFGAAVGVLFGYLPARRAAGLDPIEALRRE